VVVSVGPGLLLGEPIRTIAHWGESRTRGWRRGVTVGPKKVLLLFDVFTAILSLMEHVKNFSGRYLLKESFCLTILLNNVSFKVTNRT
jgi:hypothetical protein